MQHHGVEPREERDAGRNAVVDLREDAAHLALGRFEVGRRCGGRIDAANAPAGARRGDAHFAIDRLDQSPLPAGAHGDGLHYRHADRGREAAGIDSIAALARDIAHVERDDHRAAEALEIEDEPEIEPQVRGIYDAHEQIRRRLRGMPAQHHVTGDRLIQRRRFETVGAREIEHAVHAARVRPDEAALFALDGNAGIIRDFLAAAGEAVEQRGLPAVRHADEGERRSGSRGRFESRRPEPSGCYSPRASGRASQRLGVSAAGRAGGGGTPRIGSGAQRFGVHVREEGVGETQTDSASRRRSASAVPPRRTTKGSRPGHASAITSTRSPLTKPSSSSRRSSGVRARSAAPTERTTAVSPGRSALSASGPRTVLAGSATSLKRTAATLSMMPSMDENGSHLQYRRNSTAIPPSPTRRSVAIRSLATRSSGYPLTARSGVRVPKIRDFFFDRPAHRALGRWPSPARAGRTGPDGARGNLLEQRPQALASI